MDADAFSRLRANFLKAPAEQAAAIAASVGSAVASVALLVVLYLFADLVHSNGAVPPFAQVAPARQRLFADEWAARSDADRADAAKRVGVPDAAAKRVVTADVSPAPTPAEWEWRWRAGVYLGFRDRVGQEAADSYAARLSNAPEELPTPPKVGVLSLVARERVHWTGRLVGSLASWNPWMWRAAPDANPNDHYLLGLFVLALGLTVVRGVCLNATAYMAAACVLDVVTRVRRAVYFHTFRLGSAAVRGEAAAEPVELFTRRTESVADAVHAWLTRSFHYPVQLALLLGLALLVNVWLTVCILLAGALVWLVVGQVAAYFLREGRRAGREMEGHVGQLRESIGLIRLVKNYGMERFNQNRVERQLAEAGRANWRRLRGDALSNPLLVSAAASVAVALLYLAGRANLAGELTVAGLVVVATAVVAMIPGIQGWIAGRRAIRRGREAAAGVFEFLDRKGGAAEAADAEFVPALANRLEFRHVTVIEPGTGRKLLDDVSFAVPAGSKIAVVGPDEAEKRALVDLIPRLIDPVTGEVRLDEKNVKWVTHESLRAQVGVVLHDDLTFGDTVLNNIGTGDAGFTLPQVIEAAKLAHAHQFIERLPYGYETLIGEQGTTLEPGQRFRVALARAILRDPSVLVIEEPAGAVDDDTLALLDDTVERVAVGRTVVFLAHRQSTLRAVDRVFLLRDGKLVGSGSHTDLWNDSPTYRRLRVVADATPEAV